MFENGQKQSYAEKLTVFFIFYSEVFVMTGFVFRKLRKERCLSQSEVAGDIISTSTLSRFEAGKTNLSFDILKRLLVNLGVTVEEFNSLTKEGEGLTQRFESKVALAYFKKDISGLFDLYRTSIHAYRRSSATHDLYQAATAANFYLDLTGRQLLRGSDLAKLSDDLSDNTVWNEQTVRQFANVSAILTTRQNIAIALLLLNALNEIRQNDFEAYKRAWDALLNTEYLLLERKTMEDFNGARKLMGLIQQQELPSHLLFTTIRRSFIQLLYDLRSGKEDVEPKIFKAIEFLQEFGADQVATEFREMYDSVKLASRTKPM
ncbi:helix-turn-helix domain-containing protein [Lacticaseibacillus camelliae]|uniref:helix-turn-helix domain-containing protein n=1 Tax=Lacticaseibacillus camelliae TaxID=381742 RepID=UPI00138ED2A1|nr:helix-turn-helix transcriptional regulator [Lacticaseibacillus camelliae]